jgi:hypothetical protein
MQYVFGKEPKFCKLNRPNPWIRFTDTPLQWSVRESSIRIWTHHSAKYTYPAHHGCDIPYDRLSMSAMMRCDVAACFRVSAQNAPGATGRTQEENIRWKDSKGGTLVYTHTKPGGQNGNPG